MTIAGQVRWVKRSRKVWQGKMRGGSPVAGGGSRQVTEYYEVLQQAVPIEGAAWDWQDVPTVSEEAADRRDADE